MTRSSGIRAADRPRSICSPTSAGRSRAGAAQEVHTTGTSPGICLPRRRALSWFGQGEPWPA
jgi:hypothetical protein